MRTYLVGDRRWKLATLAVAGWMLAPAAAQIEIRWSSIDGGAALLSGGDFTMQATAGQYDAGAEMAGGDYSVDGGFWTEPILPSGCLADLNSDRKVDLSDLAALLANFGVGGGATFEDGDVNGDGKVDLSDLSLLLTEFGLSCE